jgi:hypothetical protein
MDGERFDRIAKHVATGMTRRQALKIGLGGAVAGTLGQLGRGHAAARKGKPCAHDCDCPDNQKCANNRCTKACAYTSVYCKGNVGGYVFKGICIGRDDVPLLCANMGC